MRVLIVDENADFRLVLAEYLREGAMAAASTAVRQGQKAPAPLNITEWDPASQGVPRDPAGRFASSIDVILIDSNLGAVGLVQWLASARAATRSMPPVVMLLSGRDGDALIVSAVKLGVTDCISRMELSPRRLHETLVEAMRERDAARTIERDLISGTTPAVDTALVGRAPGHDVPRIGGYVIDRLIGQGGTSNVYLARRESDGLNLVLKVLLAELTQETDTVERFMQEFSLIQKIKSQYVTRIFDFNYDRGVAYLAMEYFGAGDLRERIRAYPPPVQGLKIFAQIARALEAIHDAGVVHRDLKPHNIMFRDQHHLAIVDFGCAKALDGQSAGITKVGHVIGTPNFMSPEQILGQPLDRRSDLYSLGVILHQLLTGRVLYQAPATSDIIDMHVNAPIPRLPDKLQGFQNLLNRLVAKNPDDRFGSARELYAHIVS